MTPLCSWKFLIYHYAYNVYNILERFLSGFFGISRKVEEMFVHYWKSETNDIHWDSLSKWCLKKNINTYIYILDPGNINNSCIYYQK